MCGTSSGIVLSSDNGESWVRSPSTLTLSISSLFRAPDNSIYCCTSLNVPYRSTNNGEGWSQVPGLFGFISSFAADSHGNLFANRTAALYSSSDNGSTWNLKIVNYQGTRLQINALAIGNTDSLFAATAVGIFRSADGGTQWSRMGNGAPENTVLSLLVDHAGRVYAGRDSAVYVSTDNGEHWQSNYFTSGSLKLLANGGSAIYAWSTIDGMYSSQNDGITWSHANGDLPAAASGSVLSLSAGGQGGKDVFVGTPTGLYGSTNNGTTWKKMSDGLGSASARTLAKTMTALYAGVDGRGIFRSLDNGGTWGQLRKVDPGVHVNSIVANLSGTILAGTDNTVERSTDGGATWQGNVTGISLNQVNSIISLLGTTSIAGTSQGLFISADNGLNWNPLSSTAGIASVNTLLNLNDTIIFAGYSSGFLRSTNSGTTWMSMGLIGTTVYSLSSGSSGEIFAGTDGGVYRSYDLGENWQLINPLIAKTITTAFPRIVLLASSSGVSLSNDNGNTWEGLNAGLSGANINALLFTNNSAMIAATSSGVFIAPLPSSVIDQSVAWLSLGSLQSWFSQMGSEEDEGYVKQQQYGLQWPALSRNEDMQVSKALWIGVGNHDYPDGSTGKCVVHMGPRAHGVNEFFPVKFELVSKLSAPVIKVNGGTSYDKNVTIDRIDPTMAADRMIVNVVNTALGVTMTRKIMQFAQEYHDNYFIYDYVFKNTGNTNGDAIIENPTQKLTGVYFYFLNRNAMCADTRYVIGQNPTGWGINTLIDQRGDGNSPASTFFQGNKDNDIRSQYYWHAKYPPFTAYDNIGGPIWTPYYDKSDTVGRLGAAQFVGTATIHADISAGDTTDDMNQPATMSYESSDDPNASSNDYTNQAKCSLEYGWMTKGRVAQRQADKVGANGDPSIGTSGGFSGATGYGPYSFLPNDSVHIVIVEAAAGLSRQACIAIGRAYKLGGGASPGVMINYSDGGKVSASMHKNDWVYTGRDSLFQTFRRAIGNMKSGYTIPRAPRPPRSFSVSSSAGNFLLTWEVYDGIDSLLKGFEIYRAQGKLDSVYNKVFTLAPG